MPSVCPSSLFVETLAMEGATSAGLPAVANGNPDLTAPGI